MPTTPDKPTFHCLARGVDLDIASAQELDLIVIGGGVTGAGIALDASSRGMKTVLIDMRDFASGTSSKSTKLIHGGLRYLKQFEIGLVRETGTERAIVHRLAPHLVHPEKMLLPIVENGSFGKWSASIAISVYDYLAGVKGDERKIGLSTAEVLTDEPLLRPELIRGGGMKYSEYRTDDARLTIALIKAAVRHGAIALNHCKMTDLIYDTGKVIGVTCQDQITGREVTFHARHVVSAGGPWVDQIRTQDKSAGGKSLHLTKGVHIVFDHEKLPLQNAVYFDAFDGRMIFAIPRGKVTYVGTSDTTYEGDLQRVLCAREDADYLLNAVNNYFQLDPLGVADICSSWAGLRPLIHEDGKSPSELSRRDEIFESASGLVSIAGGKLTGYRKMAERIVDLLAKKDQGKFTRKCRTDQLKLQLNPYPKYSAVLDHIARLESALEKDGVAPYHAWHLVTMYGRNADLILAEYKARIVSGRAIDEALLLAELNFTIQHESVYRPQDFLNRRSGRTYFDMESARRHHALVVETLSSTFGWDAETTDKEREHSMQMLDDCLAFQS